MTWKGLLVSFGWLLAYATGAFCGGVGAVLVFVLAWIAGTWLETQIGMDGICIGVGVVGALGGAVWFAASLRASLEHPPEPGSRS